MKKLNNTWIEKALDMYTDGLGYLFGDSLISFYTYFTLVFAECSFLWAFCAKSLSVPFTLILLGHALNIVITAWLKGYFEGQRREFIFSILYWVDFIALFVIGAIFNINVSIILTFSPFAITALWLFALDIINFEIHLFSGPHSKIVILINKLFRNKLFRLVSQLILIGIPFVAFVVCFAQIPTLHVALKVIIPALYLLSIPLISYYEDSLLVFDIFQLVGI